MEHDRALTAIQKAAAESLALWPEARTAVLLGSRARGDHHPYSDWDIAFITEGADDRLPSVPETLPIGDIEVGQYINTLAVSEGRLDRRQGNRF